MFPYIDLPIPLYMHVVWQIFVLDHLFSCKPLMGVMCYDRIPTEASINLNTSGKKGEFDCLLKQVVGYFFIFGEAEWEEYSQKLSFVRDI